EGTGRGGGRGWAAGGGAGGAASGGAPSVDDLEAAVGSIAGGSEDGAHGLGDAPLAADDASAVFGVRLELEEPPALELRDPDLLRVGDDRPGEEVAELGRGGRHQLAPPPAAGAAPCLRRSVRTTGLGRAPREIQSAICSRSSVTFSGFDTGSKVPR